MIPVMDLPTVALLTNFPTVIASSTTERMYNKIQFVSHAKLFMSSFDEVNSVPDRRIIV